jgi:hypothetical protein
MIGAHAVSGLAFICFLQCVQVVPYRGHVMYLSQGWIGLMDVASAFHNWFVDNVINPFKSVNAVSSMMESSSQWVQWCLSCDTCWAHSTGCLLQLSVRLNWCDDCVVDFQKWQTMKQLPVETPLENAFQFHSIFACPVSREQSTAENPPMLMACGHVLCKQSIPKLVKGNSRTFKCPYCPLEITSSQSRQIYFWCRKLCWCLGTLLVLSVEIPLACSVHNSWGSIVDGSDVHIGTPWPVHCVKWFSVCDVT